MTRGDIGRLSGAVNLGIGSEAADRVMATIPGFDDFARINHHFVQRVIDHMIHAGIDQFLDLGAGPPHALMAHHAAHAIDPCSRIVYVDKDPAVAAALATAADHPRLGVICADLCYVDQVLDHDITQRTLDLSRPIGLLLAAVLHYLPGRHQPAHILRRYHERLGAGSLLAVTHLNTDTLTSHQANRALDTITAAKATLVPRTRDELTDLLGPWHPTPDGVLSISNWRPNASSTADSSPGYAMLATHTKLTPRRAEPGV